MIGPSARSAVSAFAQFCRIKAFKIAIVPSADRSMDTCTVCQTRRGHDYVVMNR